MQPEASVSYGCSQAARDSRGATCGAFVKVKEVNYMFPQGSTQRKALECLLVKMSHLEQKIHQTIKGQGKAGEQSESELLFQVNLGRKTPD